MLDDEQKLLRRAKEIVKKLMQNDRRRIELSSEIKHLNKELDQSFERLTDEYGIRNYKELVDEINKTEQKLLSVIAFNEDDDEDGDFDD